MPEAIGNDLRRRLLGAWEAKEGSLSELAARFRVSHAFAKTIRQQQRRTGKADRAPQGRHGPASRVNQAARAELRAWVREQPDRTQEELRVLLWQRRRIAVSNSRVGQLLWVLGLRRKKNASRQ